VTCKVARAVIAEDAALGFVVNLDEVLRPAMYTGVIVAFEHFMAPTFISSPAENLSAVR
jgi:hypothetical protein